MSEILKALTRRQKQGLLEVRDFTKEVLAEPKVDKRVEIDIYRVNNQYGLTISSLTNGSGGGHRIFGPKLFGYVNLATYQMSIEEIDMLMVELKAAKKFLTPKKPRKK